MPLYIVPTPVGNLKDITLRALEILKNCDIILCEDTRKSITLLRHYDIHTPLRAYHAHNEHEQQTQLITLLQTGKKLALITDAGTPGISDPAYLLVASCIAHNVEVISLPGATAFVPALVASGLSAHHFSFFGFLPIKKGRKTLLTQIADCTHTCIIYESPMRIIKTLETLREYAGGNRKVVLCRELTKIHESFYRGSINDLLAGFAAGEIIQKGEMVLLVAGRE